MERGAAGDRALALDHRLDDLRQIGAARQLRDAQEREHREPGRGGSRAVRVTRGAEYQARVPARSEEQLARAPVEEAPAQLFGHDPRGLERAIAPPGRVEAQ